MTIVDLRERGLDHRQISGFLLDVYGIGLFPADILSFLEDSVHRLEAIRDVAALQGKDAIARRAQARIQGIKG
jgi:superfamily II helicase